jgi:hypothetical protein
MGHITKGSSPTMVPSQAHVHWWATFLVQLVYDSPLGSMSYYWRDYPALTWSLLATMQVLILLVRMHDEPRFSTVLQQNSTLGITVQQTRYPVSFLLTYWWTLPDHHASQPLVCCSQVSSFRQTHWPSSKDVPFLLYKSSYTEIKITKKN